MTDIPILLVYATLAAAVTAGVCLTLGRLIQRRSRAFARFICCLFVPFLGFAGGFILVALAPVGPAPNDAPAMAAYGLWLLSAFSLPISIITSFVVFGVINRNVERKEAILSCAKAQTPPIDPALLEQGGASLYKALSVHWTSSDPNTYTHHTTSFDLDALEERYSLQLPDEFRAYLNYAAPSTTFMDDIGIQWWALSEIKSISDECPDGPPGQINPEIERERDAYLVFSDFLAWCYAWAICCSDGPNRGRVALIGGLPDTFIANNFNDFLRLALIDDLAIHQGPGK